MKYLTTTTGSLIASVEHHGYLLVIDEAGSRRVPLRALGDVVIGRAPECEIQLADASASRRHAQIDLASMVLEDLGSRHGTRVDGELLTQPMRLAAGGVIEIGVSTIVVHLANRAPTSVDVLERGPVLALLGHELARCRRHQRSLALAVAVVDDMPAALARIDEELAARDASVGRLDARTLLAIVPEPSPDLAGVLAAELPNTPLAIVEYPTDAATPGGLLAAARARLAAHEAQLPIGEHVAIVADPSMVKTFELLRRLAASDLSVLVVGETGTGKELAATALHAWSKRATTGKLIAVNCAALPPGLFESELFGHEKGAFSGAERTKPGLVELASGGTLFLDELGELPVSAQAKLLRVLEDGRVQRVGALEPIAVDFRLVAATNRDIAQEIVAGRLREDLYYRVAGAVVDIPPLRDRPRDLALLARAFLANACTKLGRSSLTLSRQALHVLAEHPFPGNVRELANVISYAAATAPDDVVEAWHLPPALAAASPVPRDASAPTGGPAPAFRPIAEEVAALEKRRMEEALAAAGGNQSRAADLIQMPRRTFVKKLARYGLRPLGSHR